MQKPCWEVTTPLAWVSWEAKSSRPVPYYQGNKVFLWIMQNFSTWSNSRPPPVLSANKLGVEGRHEMTHLLGASVGFMLMSTSLMLMRPRSGPGCQYLSTSDPDPLELFINPQKSKPTSQRPEPPKQTGTASLGSPRQDAALQQP